MNAHFGMITSVSLHSNSKKTLKDLVLTSSVDWTVKLWNLSSLTSDIPLIEFSSTSFDYVCHTHWSVVHPGVFSTITSGGILNIWNLCQSTVEPVSSLQVAVGHDDTSPTTTTGSKGLTPVSYSTVALTKTAWFHEGRKAIIGDSKGSCQSIVIAKSLLDVKPTDESKLEAILFSNTKEGKALSA